MQVELLKEYRDIKRQGVHRSLLNFIDASAKITISSELAQFSLSLRARQYLEYEAAGGMASDFAMPMSSFLPSAKVSACILGNVYFCEQLDDGTVAVLLCVEGSVVPLGAYMPGRPGCGSCELDNGWYRTSSIDFGPRDEFTFQAIGIAWIMAVLNTPGATVQERENPGFVHRDRERRITGRPASAWRNVTIVPGADKLVVRAVGDEVHRLVAPHKRREHLAWVPSQRQTPKGIFLTGELAGKRGDGWYVRVPETVVGDPRNGIAPQRHLAHMPGEKTPPVGTNVIGETAEDNALRLHVLSAAQRALMIEAGVIRSDTIH